MVRHAKDPSSRAPVPAAPAASHAIKAGATPDSGDKASPWPPAHHPENQLRTFTESDDGQGVRQQANGALTPDRAASFAVHLRQCGKSRRPVVNARSFKTFKGKSLTPWSGAGPAIVADATRSRRSAMSSRSSTVSGTSFPEPGVAGQARARGCTVMEGPRVHPMASSGTEPAHGRYAYSADRTCHRSGILLDEDNLV